MAGKLLYKSNDTTSPKITVKKLQNYRIRYFSEKIVSNCRNKLEMKNSVKMTTIFSTSLFLMALNKKKKQLDFVWDPSMIIKL